MRDSPPITCRGGAVDISNQLPHSQNLRQRRRHHTQVNRDVNLLAHLLTRWHLHEVTPRTKVLSVVLLAAILAFLAADTTPSPEPAYRSQPLSHWIEQYRVQSTLALESTLALGSFPTWGYRAPPRQLLEARSAICAIGTNALPHLIAWMCYQRPSLGTRFMPWAPLLLRQKVDRSLFNLEREKRAEAAMQALEVLGTNAAPAIPQLAALSMNTRPDVAMRSVLALSRLGPEALAPMLNVWSNSAPANKQFLSTVIAAHVLPTVNSKDQLPCLLNTLQIHTEPLHCAAWDAIWRIAPDLLTNTPSQ